MMNANDTARILIEALPVILGRGRTPLTIEEGIAVVTHAPQLLEKNRCFMLSGSRRGDRRRRAEVDDGERGRALVDDREFGRCRERQRKQEQHHFTLGVEARRATALLGHWSYRTPNP